MNEKQRTVGFILPIVVVLISILGLLWGATVGRSAEERLTEEQQLLESELLFWHKALVAFAFHQDRGMSSFNELLDFYGLEHPEFRRLDGSIVTFSNKPTWQTIVDLRVSNLPKETVDFYLQNYAPGVQAERTDGLVFPAIAIDDWHYTASLIRREGIVRGELHTDIEFNGNDLNRVTNAFTEFLTAQHGDFSATSVLGEGRAQALQTQELAAQDAYVNNVNLNDLVAKMAVLESQISSCLAPGGPCHF